MSSSRIERVVIPMDDSNTDFKLIRSEMKLPVCRTFQLQYCNVYRARLQLMRSRIEKEAKAQFDSSVKIEEIDNLKVREKAVIIGTITKRICQRPSILQELARHEIAEDLEDVDEQEEVAGCLVSNEDFLEFEDDRQICKLQGKISMDEVATGCVVGLYGYRVVDNGFYVEQVIWPSVEPQRPLPVKHDMKSGRKLAIISGLDLTGNAASDKSTRIRFDMFVRWLSGEIAEHGNTPSSQVARVLIAGNSLATMSSREMSAVISNLTFTKADAVIGSEALHVLDGMLSKLTKYVPFDLMAGRGDPTSQMWPQQAISKHALPFAGANGKTIGLRTNPFRFTLGDVDILATSGCNVSDVMRLSTLQSSCDVMDCLLKWQHLAPTCPDTLSGYPMTNRDPLIIKNIPHVFIAGNQPDVEPTSPKGPQHSMFKSQHGNCVLISVPKFSYNGKIVLLDLDTLEVTYKCFSDNNDI